jgi:hypothetical protein
MSSEDHDVQLAADLGLIRYDENKGFIISNPIYEELLMRFLDNRYRMASPPPSSWRWQKTDGSLDMDALLREFQKFWRRNSGVWEQKSDYTEVFPHLLLMGFLQRVTNGEGRVERECAAGSGRMDITVEYRGVTTIVEIKLIYDHDSPDTVLEEGLEQVRRYKNIVDENAPAYLVIFDRRKTAKETSWDQRLKWSHSDDITVVGC